MSCLGPIPPGKKLTTTQQSVTGIFRGTCGGATIPLAITHLSGMDYSIEVDAADVTCPGPLIIQTKNTEGSWVQVVCYDVGPCP